MEVEEHVVVLCILCLERWNVSNYSGGWVPSPASVGSANPCQRDGFLVGSGGRKVITKGEVTTAVYYTAYSRNHRQDDQGRSHGLIRAWLQDFPLSIHRLIQEVELNSTTFCRAVDECIRLVQT